MVIKYRRILRVASVNLWVGSTASKSMAVMHSEAREALVKPQCVWYFIIVIVCCFAAHMKKPSSVMCYSHPDCHCGGYKKLLFLQGGRLSYRNWYRCCSLSPWWTVRRSNVNDSASSHRTAMPCLSRHRFTRSATRQETIESATGDNDGRCNHASVTENMFTDEMSSKSIIENIQHSTLRLYPDSCLRTRSAEIKCFVSEAAMLRAVVHRMAQTMYSSHAVGIAAPQLGVSKRVVILNVDPFARKFEETVLINPCIEEFASDVEELTEGCLSFPGIILSVTRPSSVRVRFQTMQGNTVERWFHNWEARVCQHELDHLDGVLFHERATIEERHRVELVFNQTGKKWELP
eukprot:GHVQ01026010.1.p1 GENE.GHVQ01026010.1~~GHVQ01026010.1.p1  ORF type:complete len:348 (-),score=30.90 GHVQ01026010.1:430-1473(-)